MRTYAADRERSDLFIPHVKDLVGPYLLVETPKEIDCEQAADLMVLTANNLRIAARVRNHGYAARYPNEFTIRAKRDNGFKTELCKILEGWSNWFFYGHANEKGNFVEIWWLIDLNSFRLALKGNAPIRRGIKPNGDGTHLAWFDITSFPPRPPILVASGFEVSRFERGMR